MYATTIGRTFLKAYNCKFKTEYTAKSFFEDVFVPLFFDHHKYMMTAGNSPLRIVLAKYLNVQVGMI